ncbi:Zinc finger RAD18 domain-containing protein C1orf124-like [Papilio machaon]|uniref:Protein with SprT-like domain at the N terminus n=1 Tax=Papilio machaon TaxID=76193 RepID=A0A194QPF7_PAPMA|nr:Zinc finger RAD18 domain-containing protein C1orf124-like [Papilio machaon]
MQTGNVTEQFGGIRKMNLADPELELIDPTPDVHSLFLHFDKLFFWTKLASRVAVRWSKRMYSCAGICSYDCRSHFCDIALSEPLLKLRPRKDLIETLLHEMIHAFLFVTCKDQDRDGHGPNFKEHMYRINKLAGVNITIYHDFHDEVKLYQTHWWRCNGPCQKQKPYFGVVRRSANRAPGPTDYWWSRHQKKCGGTFVKIKEPEKTKSTKAKETKQNKPKENITKYINNNKDLSNKNTLTKPSEGIKNNNNKTIIVAGNIDTSVSQVDKKLPTNKVRNSIDSRKSLQSNDVVETVRNVWTNKQLPVIKNNNIDSNDRKTNSNTKAIVNSNKQKSRDSMINSPPNKIRKIDDYFKNVVTTVLKDIYGEDFKISESEKDKKLIASKIKLVHCPICNVQIKEDEINRHLDECLNKGIIDKITKSNTKTEPTTSSEENKINVQINNIKTEPIDNNNVETPSSSDNSYIVKKPIKIEPGCSKDIDSELKHNCPCCGKTIEKSVAEHLDECLSFFDNNTKIPEEGASTSFIMETIVIDDDDDDILDETQTFNATGTKSPCPCCLKMIEQNNMNDHLDICLSS